MAFAGTEGAAALIFKPWN